ncbi:MAG: threonine synthase, partial [bacterium]|nr:threonine synthase [bacterium]
MLEYCSTRRKKSNPINVNFSHAILNPIAEYGGLYAPSEIPLFSENCLNSMISLSYDELAIYILNKFGVDIPNEVIQNSLQCYDLFDYSYNPVPIVKLYENIYVAELWHGPTRSFKDMALQAFPYLLSNLATKFDKKYIIAVATSGDTGPAALEGFKDLPSTKIICYYPLEGTSSIQAEQMQKAQGANTKVFGVNTDFDGLQKELKDMLKSSTINEYLKYKGYELSAANSVNFGRIVFQVVYHFCSYFKMLKLKELKFGDSIDYIIPSGNFGNALAAFYAKMMGLPIGKIILASNENNI